MPYLLQDLLLGDAGDLGSPRVVQLVEIFDVVVGRWPLRIPFPDPGD
jgi:hypothetical protein